MLSQVLAGLRNPSEEQTFELSTYLGHGLLETEYFDLLVRKERAGSENLRGHLEKKLARLKSEALKLAHRVSHDRVLSDEDRAVFYSSWIYSAIHLFSSIKKEGVSLEDISTRFSISRARAVEIIQFLIQSKLVVEKKSRYLMGTQSTWVSQESPHSIKHHTNWRLKAMQKTETVTQQELMYSGQFSISRKDFETLREVLADFLKSANKTVKDSPPEEIACLNIDWFWI